MTHTPPQTKTPFFMMAILVAAVFLSSPLAYAVQIELIENPNPQPTDVYQLLPLCESNAPPPISRDGDKPSDTVIAAWAKKAAQEYLSLDEQNAKEKLIAQKPNFTPKGWCDLIIAYNKSRILEVIKNRHLTQRAELYGNGEINKKLAPDGAEEWIFKAPTKISYHSTLKDNAQDIPSPLTATLFLHIRLQDNKPVITQSVLRTKSEDSDKVTNDNMTGVIGIPPRDTSF